MSDTEDTEPGTYSSAQEEIAALRKELLELKHPALESEDSAEIKVSPSRKHLLFKPQRHFWGAMLEYSWNQASAFKRAQLIVGGLTFQGALFTAFEFMKHHFLAALAAHGG